MRSVRQRLIYFVLLPAIAVAAGILTYFSWRSASQYAALGEETIVESTLLLVREKVDLVEQYIIGADNRVMALAEFDEPVLSERWRPVAAQLSPSVRAVVVLDDSGQMLDFSIRGTAEDERDFLKVFTERILPNLELERQTLNRLKHLHQTLAGKNFLISYKAYRHRGRRHYVVLHHDTGFLVREELAQLFATEEGKQNYNVVDEENRRVYGPSLARAGDYLVGHRFPTTLYNWRLQVAPKQAPLLDAQVRNRQLNEVALVGTAFFVLLLGVGFLLYAAGKERQLNVSKSEFIANVSHELKTPLSVVRMFAELLLTKRVRSEEKQEQYLEIICTESERLTTLIENVLDFAAVERGQQKYELVPGDVRDVVGRAIEAVRYRMEREGTEVTLEVAGEPPEVAFDEQALLLATINLLDNAVKYGGKTPVTVQVRTAGRAVEIRVRDRGPGIPPEDVRRIFDRFYRSRHESPARGSGIGLSLVKHIAEAHGGRAYAENAEDGGAIVTIALPLPRRSRRNTGAAGPAGAEPAPAQS